MRKENTINDPLYLDFCSYKAARTAVMRWHYSKTMPVGKLVRVGVWESGRFVGTVIYGRGASSGFHKRFKIGRDEVVELVRVALDKHRHQTSQIVSISMKLLERASPGLRLVYSFADPRQGHHGGIYQAGNWVHDGQSSSSTEFFHKGRWKHNREITAGPFGKPRTITHAEQLLLPTRATLPKHRYLYPLDRAMRKQIQSLCKPYPKRQPSKRGTGDHPEQGGAEPTLALHSLGSAHE